MFCANEGSERNGRILSGSHMGNALTYPTAKLCGDTKIENSTEASGVTKWHMQGAKTRNEQSSKQVRVLLSAGDSPSNMTKSIVFLYPHCVRDLPVIPAT